MKRGARSIIPIAFLLENCGCVLVANVLSVTSFGVYSHLEMLQSCHAKQAGCLLAGITPQGIKK